MSPQTIALSPADELHRLARLASRNETFMEDDAVILRGIAKHVVKATEDRDRLAVEVAQQGTRLFAAESERDRLSSLNDQLAAEHAGMAGEIRRLGEVIRELQNDLEAAHQENSRLENPDQDD